MHVSHNLTCLCLTPVAPRTVDHEYYHSAPLPPNHPLPFYPVRKQQARLAVHALKHPPPRPHPHEPQAFPTNSANTWCRTFLGIHASLVCALPVALPFAKPASIVSDRSDHYSLDPHSLPAVSPPVANTHSAAKARLFFRYRAPNSKIWLSGGR